PRALSPVACPLDDPSTSHTAASPARQHGARSGALGRYVVRKGEILQGVTKNPAGGPQPVAAAFAPLDAPLCAPLLAPLVAPLLPPLLLAPLLPPLLAPLPDAPWPLPRAGTVDGGAPLLPWVAPASLLPCALASLPFPGPVA